MDPISTLTSPSSLLFSAWSYTPTSAQYKVGTPPWPLLQLLTHSTAPGGNEGLNILNVQCTKLKGFNLVPSLNRAELLFLHT